MHAVGPQVNVLFPFQGPLIPLLEFVFPTGFQSRDGRGRKPGAVRSHQCRQGFVEVAGADAFQVQPRDQLLQALGLAKVRRKNLGGKTVCFAGGPSIEHAWLLDLDRAHARGDRAFRQTAVANYLTMALRVL